MVSTRQEGSTPRVGGGNRSGRAPRMNTRKRQNAAWALEWQHVDHRDREERRQRALAIILPQRAAKARHHQGEKPKAATHHALRQRVQGSPRRGRHRAVALPKWRGYVRGKSWTTPWAPSSRMGLPSGIRWVARWTLRTAGMPYSRATMAPWDR